MSLKDESSLAFRKALHTLFGSPIAFISVIIELQVPRSGDSKSNMAAELIAVKHFSLVLLNRGAV
jgi:hypothetical protein